MGGEITVQSQVNHGSIFSFILTFKKATSQTQTDSSAESQQLSNIFANQRLNILIAEDNVTNQVLLNEMLEYLGLKADIVSNGLEATNSCKEKPYNIILMDIHMDTMNGIDACEIIRKNKKIHQPYIIAVTANVMDADRQISMDIGMNDFLTKPVSLNGLHEVIKNFIDTNDLLSNLR